METGTYKKILVATDYTDLAENALRTAAVLCHRHNAELVLLHVVRDAPAYTPEFEFNPSQDYTREMKLAARGELRHLADRVRKEYEIPVEEMVAFGDVVTEIVRTIPEFHPDLVLLGTHGASGFRRFFMGSTAYRVIKHTTFPVMTIPGTGDWTKFRKILFPIRLIPDALKKYDHIRPILLKDFPRLQLLGLSMESDPLTVNKVFELEEELETRLHADQVSFEVSYHHCENYADQILASAQEKGSDLIVIIATIDRTQGDFFIGPFSQQILNHAKIPVLCVRSGISGQ